MIAGVKSVNAFGIAICGSLLIAAILFRFCPQALLYPQPAFWSLTPPIRKFVARKWQLEWKKRTGCVIVSVCVAIIVVLSLLAFPLTHNHIDKFLDRTQGMNLEQHQEYVIQCWKRFRTRKNLTRIALIGALAILCAAVIVAALMRVS
jgi:hypothetical protein